MQPIAAVFVVFLAVGFIVYAVRSEPVKLRTSPANAPYFSWSIRAAYQLLLELDVPISITALRDAAQQADSDGDSQLEACARVLQQCGVSARVTDLSMEMVAALGQPAIVVGPQGHLVVVKKVRTEFYLLDYPRPPEFLATPGFHSWWPRRAILVDPMPRRPWGTSSLVASSRVIDFGSIDAGVTVERTFTIYNPTDAPIAITRVDTSCGCTLLKGDLTALREREAAEFVLKFDSRGKEGLQEHMCIVHANDGFVPLRVSGYVAIPVGFNPRTVNFGRVAVGEIVARCITFSAPDEADNDQRVILAVDTPESVSYQIRRGAPRKCPRLSERLFLTFTPNEDRTGRFDGAVRIRYRVRGEAQEVEIPCRAVVVGYRKIQKLVVIHVHKKRNTGVIRTIPVPGVVASTAHGFAIRPAGQRIDIVPRKADGGDLVLDVHVSGGEGLPRKAVVEFRVRAAGTTTLYEIILVINTEESNETYS